MNNLASDYKNTFSIIATDSFAWLEQAQCLQIASKPILKCLLEIANESQTIDHVRLKKLSFVSTYMLIMGFAFENLLKAIAVSRRLITLNNSKLKFDSSLPKTKSQHSLSQYCKALKVELTSEETDYLKRIEEYVYWAGRYPLPINSSEYIKCCSENLLSFSTTDTRISDNLFTKLSELLKISE